MSITINEIQAYVNEIAEAQKKEWERLKYVLPYPTFTIESGIKYHRIVRYSGQRSAHCFVDNEGNIYKVASWKTPAKGIRGNIKDVKKPLLGYDFYRR